MQRNNGTNTSVHDATNIMLWKGVSSEDNAQECECGSTLHGSSIDKAGTSTSARGLGGGTCRRTRFGVSIPGTLSGRKRCGVDRRGGCRWGGRSLLAGEVGTLQK